MCSPFYLAGFSSKCKKLIFPHFISPNLFLKSAPIAGVV